MAITLNAKGTTVPYFKIGKGGITIYQGSVDPTGIYNVSESDLWIDTQSKSIKFRASGTTGSSWVDNTTTASDSFDEPIVGSNMVLSGVNALDVRQVTTNSTTEINVDLFDVADYTSGKLLIQATDNSSGHRHITEITILYGNGSVISTEYGTLTTSGNNLADFDTNVSSGIVKLNITPTSNTQIDYNISLNLLSV